MRRPIDDDTIQRMRDLCRTMTKREVAETLSVSYRSVLRYTSDIPKPRGYNRHYIRRHPGHFAFSHVLIEDSDDEPS